MTTNNGNVENASDAKDQGGQDVEIQETITEDDFIEGLDIVDTWDDEEKDKPRRRSWDRARGRDKRTSRDREKEKEKDRERDRDRDRDHHRGRRRSRSNGRRSRSRGRRSRSNGRRSRSNERRREYSRRDPNKSSKDIEQDKMRTKKDNDSKILAEKEKAIKTLLDSDDVVPPGTEGEAIQNIVEKNQQEKEQEEKDKEKDKEKEKVPVKMRLESTRRRSPIRSRLGPRRFSPRRSPLRFSPDRRRSPITFSPDRRRRRSNDRDTSADRREASRRRLRERRRSRSRDRRSTERHRSRSAERRRSRSNDRHRRSSRSPFERRRRRSSSRSPRSDRRKRSPFLNELARQFQNEANPALAPIHGANPSYIPPGPGMMPGGLLPGPQQVIPGVPGPMDIHAGPMPPMHPGAVMHPGPGMPGAPGPPFMNYEAPGPGINYGDPMNHGVPPPPEYNQGPVLYNQPNPMPIPHPMQVASPKPVPAPGQQGGIPLLLPTSLGPSRHRLQVNSTVPGPKYSPNEDMFKREERMKTPEPPIISDNKQNEKTSLSSLLEASVTSKDWPSSAPFKGFKPEIVRHCEKALRNLPSEDPRLKMTGRFFFDPTKKDAAKDKVAVVSNSILLRKGRTEIHWDEEEDMLSTSTKPRELRKNIVTHQKICQTDEVTKESSSMQTEETTTADFGMQVELSDLVPPAPPAPAPAPVVVEERRAPDSSSNRWSLEENRRPAPAEWTAKETYDHAASIREKDDLRWNMNNNSGRDRQIVGNQWASRGFSPSRQPIVNDHMHGNAGGLQLDSYSRNSGSIDHMRDRGGPMDSMMDRSASVDSVMDRGPIDRVGPLDRAGLLDRGGPMDRGGPLDRAGLLDRASLLDRGNLLDRGGFMDRGGPMERGGSMDSMMDRGIPEMHERDVDLRDRDMDMRDMRMMEMMRDRERMMDSMREARAGGSGGMMDMMASRGGGGSIDEFGTRRQPVDDYQPRMDDYQSRIDDYDLRKNFNSVGGGGGGAFSRPMDAIDRERLEMAGRVGNSPRMMDDDSQDLEVIEERGFDNRDKPWQSRNANNLSLAQLNNARGGIGRGGLNRSFRGRLGGFRMNY